MKTSQRLGLIAGVVFLVSFLLPAYGGSPGYGCFGVAWDVMMGKDVNVFSGGWFYYTGFVLANALFVVLAAALFTTGKGRRTRTTLAGISFLHVLSWMILHLFDRQTGLSEIKIGYYVWLAAFGLLAAAHLRRERLETLEPRPAAPPVIS